MKNAKRSHTLKGSDLLALLQQAVRQGKEPLYLLRFEDARIEVELRPRRF